MRRDRHRIGLMGVAAIALLIAQTSLAATHYVSLSSTNPVPPYTNWVTAAINMQDAVNAAMDGDDVMVEGGTYQLSTQILITNSVLLQSLSGAAATILDGMSATRCVQLASTGAVLKGFTVTRGWATTGAGIDSDGGTIRDCIISGNSATGGANWGGGVYLRHGVLSNCTITGNAASGGNGLSHMSPQNGDGGGNGYGGGVYCEDGALLSFCTIQGNVAHGGDGGSGRFGGAGGSVYGGGVYCAGNCTLDRCVIQGNSGSAGTGGYGIAPMWGGYGNGGGVYAAAGTVLRNCLVAGNAIHAGLGYSGADRAAYGGGVYAEPATVVENCTIATNAAQGGGTATAYGAGLYGMAGSTGLNCIIYFNTGAGNWDGAIACTYSCTTPDPGGTGNITNDPGFVATNTGDYHLLFTAPCVNVGSNQSWMTGENDLGGVPRVLDGTVDIGCYEQARKADTQGPAITEPVSVPAGQSNSYVATSTPLWIRGDKPAELWTVKRNEFGGYDTNGIMQAAGGASWSDLVAVAGTHITLDYRCATGVTLSTVGTTSTYLTIDFQGYGTPLVTVTTRAVAVPLATTSFVVQGFNNGHVVGTLWVSNAANADVFWFAAPVYPANQWTAPAIGLAVGNNAIFVCGTNRLGAVASDSVAIERRAGMMHYVAKAGTNPVVPFGSWPTAATNLQTALAVAIQDDTVLVSTGTYIISTTVVVPGGVTLLSTEGAAHTIIDGNSSCRGCVMSAGSILEGFTVTRGRVAGNGAGVYCSGGEVRQCVIVSNAAVGANGASHDDFDGETGQSVQGGGLYCDSTAVVVDCVFVGNVAAGGSGGYSYYGHGGTAGSARGGGISCAGGTRVHSCVVERNQAIGGEGGWSYGGYPPPPIPGGDAAGGGLWCDGEVQVYSVVCVSNGALGGKGGSFDAAPWWIGQGGTASGAGVGGSLFSLINSRVTWNTATGGDTDGSAFGGGVYAAAAQVLNSAVIRNEAWGDGAGAGVGGGLYAAAAVTARNCIVYFNVATSAVPDCALGTNNLFEFVCTTTNSGGTGNTTNDPQFVNAAAGNFHLLTNSPCIDTGTNLTTAGITNDLDGMARPLDGNNDGLSEFDMGCYEGGNPGADADGDGLDDYRESSIWGTDRLNPDTDGDSGTDGGEVLAGTDPLDATSCLDMKYFGKPGTVATGMVIRWSSTTNMHYRLLRGTNLMDGFGHVVESNIPATPTLNVYTDETAAGPSLFYRIDLELPP